MCLSCPAGRPERGHAAPRVPVGRSTGPMGDDGPVMTSVRAKPDAVAMAAVDAGPCRPARGRRTPPTSASTSAPWSRASGWSPTCSPAPRPGYAGWRWSVTVTRASRQKTVTVCEVVLIPGDEAIVAPEWVPYRERIKPGDLSPGDLLPVADDDPRLVPTYSFGDDPLDADEKAQVRAGRLRARPRPGPHPLPGGPRPGRPAVVRRRRRPRLRRSPRPRPTLPQLRLPGPHRRRAGRLVRRLRQRRRQRRRPGGLLRPRLRRPLRGPAGPQARAPAAARARCTTPSTTTSRRASSSSEPVGAVPDRGVPFDCHDVRCSGRAGARPRAPQFRYGRPSARAAWRRRQYSRPKRPRPEPARQVHSHQVRSVSARAPQKGSRAEERDEPDRQADLDGAHAVDVEGLDVGDDVGAFADLVLGRLRGQLHSRTVTHGRVRRCSPAGNR